MKEEQESIDGDRNAGRDGNDRFVKYQQLIPHLENGEMWHLDLLNWF